MTTDTKSALLDHAEHFARARGFDGFSYADLANAVGIRKASVHYHFPSKGDLSAALMDRYTSTMSSACDAVCATHDKASGQLLGLVSIYRDALKAGETLCLCVSFTISHQSFSSEVNAKVSQFRQMMVRWLTAVFERGVRDGSIAAIQNPEAEARAALALLEGAHLAARAEENVRLFDEAVEVLKSRC